MVKNNRKSIVNMDILIYNDLAEVKKGINSWIRGGNYSLH